MRPIYLDHNASTPLLREVIEAMTPYLRQGFGNPSSSHWYGQKSRAAVEKARDQVAALLNCHSEEIIFTSGGSESNNLAIRGIAEQYPGGHIITSAIEHPAVLAVCKYLENKGYDITYAPVDEFGIIDPEEIRSALRTNTMLITIMLANNEVGTLQPVADIAGMAQEHNIPLHTDAAQAVGKHEVDVQQLGIDLLSLAGHKMNASKGIGALYIRSGIQLAPLLHGAGHEKGLRPGTENVLEIVGLGQAAEVFHHHTKTHIKQQLQLREQLWEKLKRALPDIKLNGHPEKRLPNTANIYFPGVNANTLLSQTPLVAASAGAACHADAIEPSYVLQAMGFSNERALQSIRFSVGKTTQNAEIKIATEKIISAVKQLQRTEQPRFITTQTADIKLTQYTHGLGCACKIRPQTLEKVLQKMMQRSALTPDTVGFETADDAAVYPLSPETILVATVDFFTPVVDDAFDFGRIAAANSLSDIYAMGAKPLFALNITAFPEERLPLAVLEQILAGAQEIAQKAGIAILGGHTVEDNEPKFGMAVIGTAHPEKLLKNSTAQAGDILVLTKPLGSGVLSTALKRGLLNKQQTGEIVSLMAELNAAAAEVAARYPCHACTDITGFGLVGHLLEMVKASQCSALINVGQVPVLSSVADFVRRRVIPGGTKANQKFTAPSVEWGKNITDTQKIILNDAQTSGGLLITLPAAEQKNFIRDLHQKGIPAAQVIGEIIPQKPPKITIK